MPYKASKIGAAERTWNCIADNVWGLNNRLFFLKGVENTSYYYSWSLFLFVARCFLCLILPQISSDYRSVLGMNAIHYDQDGIWWLWYAKPVYTGRHANNDIAGKYVCISMMYFCCPIRKVDASHGWDRRENVNKTLSFGAWNYRGWNNLW